MRCHNSQALKELKSLSKDDLTELYRGCGRNPAAVASKLGLSRTAVTNALKSANVTRRSLSEFVTERNLAKNCEPLSEQQHTMILGCLLGDSCLYEQSGTNKGLGLRFCHSIKQLGYLKHKHALFNGRASKLSDVPLNNFGSKRKAFTFTSTPCLTEYKNLCITSGTKTVSQEWCNKLTLEAISYWYEDDGCLVVLNERTSNSLLSFHTQSFTECEVDLLRSRLKQFGLSTRIGFNSERQPIIFSRFSDEARLFLGTLTCHHPCLQYKFKTAIL